MMGAARTSHEKNTRTIYMPDIVQYMHQRLSGRLRVIGHIAKTWFRWFPWPHAPIPGVSGADHPAIA